MTNRKSKRLLSLLLSLVMVFSLTATPMLAADEEDTSSGIETSEAEETSSASTVTFSEPEAVEAEIVTAVEDAEEELFVYEDANAGIAMIDEDDSDPLPTAQDGVITLTGDVSLTETYTVSTDVTIDLNGHSITRAEGSKLSYLITVNSDVTLTIKDSGSNGQISNTNFTETTTDDEGNETNTTYAGNAIYAYGKVVIESGTVSGYYGVYVDGGELTVKGGTVSGTGYGVYQASGSTTIKDGSVSGAFGVIVYGGTVTVEGGTVSGSQRGISVSSTAASGTKVTVSDGKVEGSTYAIAQLAGEVSISGGEVTSTNNIAITARGTALTVSGGTVSGGVRGIEMTSGTTSITGGTVTGGNYGLIQFGGTATVSGGTVSGFYAGAYVTGSSTSLTVSDSAEVKSTVTSSETTNYASTAAIAIWYGAEVTINGGTVTGGYCGVGIYAGNSTSDMSTLIVNGGSISAFGFGVSTNGSYSYDYIEINGGTIYGGGTGMYLPAMESSTVINDGTITGGNTGIEIRAGSLEVTGGTIKSEYTGSLATENNNSGTTVVGAGIAVSQHTTDKAITVAISGGEISGIYGVYEINYNTSNTSEVKVNVTEDSDGTSATITTTDSSQGAAVYSTSLDTSSTKTNAQNASVTSIALSAGTYNSDVSEYCGTSYTTTTSNGGTTYTVTTGSAVVSVTTSDGNTTQYANLKAALAAASAGDTVTLLGDLTIDSQLTIDKDITLDLGGYTLTNTFVNESGTGANRFTLITTADVTIQNGTYVTTAPETTNGVETRGICQSSGDLTLSDLTVTCNGINVCNYAEEGKLTITNCNISGTYAVSSFANKSTVTITDSTLTGSVCGLYHNGSYYGLTLTATDTTITGGSADSSVEGATDATAVYISGSTYTVANNNDEEHQVSFTNCTITGSTGIEVKYTDLTLTNCTVTATGTTPTYEQYNNGSTTAGFAVVSTDNSMDGEDPLPSGTVIIKGGTYTGEVGLASIVDTETYTNFKEANYEIYAGTFSTDVSDYCVDGLTAAATGDVFIIVEESAVAVVYDKDDSYVGSYTTLKTAYAAVTDGGTMILVNDVDGEQLGATSDKEVTLDLNGYIISRDSGSVIDCSNGTLTIKDSSQTDSAIGTGMVQGNGNVALKLRGGTVVLESGTLESTSTYAVTMSSGTLTVNGGAVIAASNANCIFYYTGGTLMINDGLFTVVDRASTVEEGDVTGAIVNVGSSTASTASEDDEETNVQVSITGGVFQMYRPLLGSDIELEITGGYFLSKYSLSEYYPVGYGYTKVDSYTYLGTKYTNYYQVAHINFTLAVTSGDTTTESYYKTLVAAVNAAIDAYASTGSATITIKLENDYETGKVPVEKEVEFTLNLNGYTLTSTDVGVFKINNSDATVTIIDDSEAGTGTITTADSSTATTSTTGLFQVSSGTLNITGGYFNQNAGQSLIAGSGTVNITGGYFTSDPSDYIGNYEVATNDSETYHCYVADIISGKNIDLDNGKITLNVYVNESIIDATISASMTGAANDATVNDNVVSQKVEAKMMADDLAVTVTLSNGYVVTYKTSVEEYADEQLETLSVDSETDAAEIAVLTAMLDYGTAVQEFYSYNTENKANDGTYSSDVDKVSESDLKSAATRKSSTSGNWTSSNKISSWNMYGNYDVTLTMTYSFELTDYTASVMIGGETYENISTNGKVLTISGLGVEQLSKSLVVTITNSADNSSYTITTTGLYYARLMVTSGTDAQKKVGQTIYLYAKALN